MRKHLVIAGLLILLFSCKEKEIITPLKVIVDPKLSVSKNQLAFGNISSSSKGTAIIKKNIPGEMSYTFKSNKNWIIIDSQASALGMIPDTLRFHVDILSSDIVEGENNATITIIPNIKGVAQAEKTLSVSGNFKATVLKTSMEKIDVGTITKDQSLKIKLTKEGLENITYTVVSDKTWLKSNKQAGTVLQHDSLQLSLDPTNLNGGPFEANLTIQPSVLGKALSPLNVKIFGTYDDTITGTINGHTLSKNETWGGNIYLTGSIIIPAGNTLTIKPGTIIKVKKLADPLSITINGKLLMNGSLNNIIDIRSEINSDNDSDWEGILANNELEMSYVYIKNAEAGLSFKNQNNNVIPSFRNVFFDANRIAILGYKSSTSSIIKNLTFRNIYYFCIAIDETKSTLIDACEFLTETCYIDIRIASNNGTVSIENSNFSLKKFAHQINLEVIDGYKNNKITANRCFRLLGNNSINVNGNSFSAINTLNNANSGVGCGFGERY